MVFIRIPRISHNPALVARPHAAARYFHSAGIARAQASGTQEPGKDPRLSQGTVRKEQNLHPGDVQDQAARSGQASADKSPLDAASGHGGKKASRDGVSGNPEGMGFAEQVGSGSATASGETRGDEGVGGKEEATPPGLLDAVKNKLRYKTTSGEVKQNRRALHTSATLGMPAGDATTKGQALEASRQPKDWTYSEQNEHLRHRESPGASKGKGNAAGIPGLPSHEFDDKPNGQHRQRRSIHTSARRQEAKHTADSYFKDVDNSPPKSSKTHQVDPSDEGKIVTPNDPETGEFSQKGPDSKEYQTVNRNDPYDVPGQDENEMLRYGGLNRYKSKESTGGDVSKPGEGPEGATAGGHRPERRK